MTTNPSQLPDIFGYIDLLDRFIAHQLAAPAFDASYLQMVKSEDRALGEPVYPVLQELFEDADAYVERPELRTEPDDLDDEQLRECALRARQALKEIGYS